MVAPLLLLFQASLVPWTPPVSAHLSPSPSPVGPGGPEGKETSWSDCAQNEYRQALKWGRGSDLIKAMLFSQYVVSDSLQPHGL